MAIIGVAKVTTATDMQVPIQVRMDGPMASRQETYAGTAHVKDFIVGVIPRPGVVKKEDTTIFVPPEGKNRTRAVVT